MFRMDVSRRSPVSELRLVLGWSLAQQNSLRARSAKTGGTVSGEYRGLRANFPLHEIACIFGLVSKVTTNETGRPKPE
jgi:hypothetical protein